MTYVIRKDGQRYTDVETERALLAFLSHYIAAMVDGVHVTTDGDLLIRMGHGYTVERDMQGAPTVRLPDGKTISSSLTGGPADPKVVRLPHGGVVNAEDKPA